MNAITPTLHSRAAKPITTSTRTYESIAKMCEFFHQGKTAYHSYKNRGMNDDEIEHAMAARKAQGKVAPRYRNKTKDQASTEAPIQLPAKKAPKTKTVVMGADELTALARTLEIQSEIIGSPQKIQFKVIVDG